MVLSWRGDQFQHTNRVFDGSREVNMLLFYFENVIMCGKDADEKSLEVIPHPDVEASQLFLDKFPGNEKLNDAASDF